MFQRFLAEHSLDEYSFRNDLFPTVEDREFWENYPNDTCIAEAEAALDYAWPVVLVTNFMAFKRDAVILDERYSVRATGAKISAGYIPFADEKLEADWHTQGVTRICFDFENVEKICIEVERI